MLILLVTEEEVYRGILTNSNATDQCLCFYRTLTGINLEHQAARKFIDMVDGKICLLMP